MELKRLTRLLRARWFLIALAAALGLGAAYFAADWWNRRIEPNYRATAALTYLGTQITSRGGGADPQLQSMLTLAI